MTTKGDVGLDVSSGEAPAARADDESSARLLDRNPRGALITFIVLLVGAFGFYVWAGRHQWFFLDEWDFLAGRRLSSIDDLLRPHNEHWSTVSIVLWRLLWSVFGIRTYRPYQLFSIANCLGIAALLRVVMRRAGVGPWIATAVAGALVLFGSGSENVLWAFQVQFAGPLLFGLIHLLLADHRGPLDRRDWLGLMAGLAALMSSGLGVAMVFVVGLSMLLSRGWRIALFHTAPLAAIYAAWWYGYGRDALPSTYSGLGLTRDFVVEGYRRTFESLGVLTVVGILLVVTLVVGLILAWHRIDRPEVRRRAATPLALLVGGVVFLAIAGSGRASVLGVAFAGTSRYQHVVAVMTLSALAVAIDAIYRRWQVVGMAAGALLLVGIPGNVRRTVDYDERNRFTLGQPGLFLAAAHSPLARSVPRESRPFPDSAPEVTVGWLIDGVASGKIPESDPATDDRFAPIVELRLGLQQLEGPRDPKNCRALTKPEDRQLQPGDAINFSGGPLQVFDRQPGAPRTYNVIYPPEAGDQLVVVGGPLSVTLVSPNRSSPTALCE